MLQLPANNAQNVSYHSYTIARDRRCVPRPPTLAHSPFSASDPSARHLGRGQQPDSSVSTVRVSPPPDPSDDEELQGLVCHLTLQTVDGDDASNIRYRDDGRIVNMSAGHHVKTAIRMLDQTGAPGLYFVFTDTGVRHAGRFRFKAFLMRISG